MVPPNLVVLLLLLAQSPCMARAGGEVRAAHVTPVRGGQVRAPGSTTTGKRSLRGAVTPRSLMFEESNYEWGLDRIDSLTNRNGVYNYDFQGEGLFVYVLDSGVDASHNDFAGVNPRVLQGYTAFPASMRGTPANTDTYGHGTHVASTIAGFNFGIAKKVTIIPVRVLGGDGSGTYEGLIDGLDWAMRDAQSRKLTRKIINLSLEAPWSTSVEAKMQQVRESGFILVAAAGNSKGDACKETPGGSKHVISVGSIASYGQEGAYVDQISDFSNWGKCVSVFAPGSLIPGAEAGNEDEDVLMSGTSMATPHVAGIVALLWSKYPSWTNTQIQTRVLREVLRESINLKPCATKKAGNACVSSTTNTLVQAPFAEVLLVGNLDTVFAMANFGSSPSYWPRLRGQAVVFSQGVCDSTAAVPSGDVTDAFAVVDMSPCDDALSAYFFAMRVQNAKAKALIVIHPACRTYGSNLMNLPASVDKDQVRIPVVCVPTSEDAATTQLLGSTTSGALAVQLGLVRAGVTGGSAPWAYAASGNALEEMVREWRVDWSGTGNGMSPGSMCFEFSAQVVSGSASSAQLLVALSSREQYELTAMDSPPDGSYSRYVIRSSVRGNADILRNDGMGQLFMGKGEASLSSPVRMFVRAGVFGSERTPWAVEFGHATASGELSEIVGRFEDRFPLFNVNYVSFSASPGATVLYSNIKPCSVSGLGKGLFGPPQSGSGGGGSATSRPTAPPSSKDPQPTLAPVSSAPTSPGGSGGGGFDTSKCGSLSGGPAQCRGRSGLACRWKAGRCVAKP